jgi:hypothetical protein
MMKISDLSKKILWVLVSAILCIIIFLTARVNAATNALPDSSAASQPKLHYQGRLLNPTTGMPKADGTYTMLFGVYTASTGGSPIWNESKDVTVNKGIFSTLLGDTTPFDTAIFNGQNLWLGVTVGGDPQMTPRNSLAYVPYAVFANNADKLDGNHSGSFALASHSHAVLPQAYGYISRYSDPPLRPGSYHVDSAVWNSTLMRYEITLTGFNYSIDDITAATLLGDTGSCPAGATIRTTSVSGMLLVYIVDSAGTKIQCSFNFVTFAGQ